MPNIQPISELRIILDTLNWLPADQGIIQLLKELHTEGDEYDEP